MYPLRFLFSFMLLFVVDFAKNRQLCSLSSSFDEIMLALMRPLLRLIMLKRGFRAAACACRAPVLVLCAVCCVLCATCIPGICKTSRSICCVRGAEVLMCLCYGIPSPLLRRCYDLSPHHAWQALSPAWMKSLSLFRAEDIRPASTTNTRN